MATINPPTNISSGGAGTWEFKVEAGRNYNITCKQGPGSGYTGSTLSLKFEDQANPGGWLSVDDSTFDGTTRTGLTFRAPTGTMQLASSGSIGGLVVTVTPLFEPLSR